MGERVGKWRFAEMFKQEYCRGAPAGGGLLDLDAF